MAKSVDCLERSRGDSGIREEGLVLHQLLESVLDGSHIRTQLVRQFERLVNDFFVEKFERLHLLRNLGIYV